MHINKHHAKVSIVHSEELKNQATGFNLPTLHILKCMVPRSVGIPCSRTSSSVFVQALLYAFHSWEKQV